MSDGDLGLPIERLDFQIPDFTHIHWQAEDARDIWADRVARVSAAFTEIEWRSVEAGIRKVALVVASPEEFMARCPIWLKSGLATLPIEIQGVTASTSVPQSHGGPFALRAAVGRPDDLLALMAAFDSADETAMAELLSFPSCCQRFFQRVLVDEGLIDTTWSMAANTPNAHLEDDVISVFGAPEANILGRWSGLRAVPHLPCSFQCEPSIALGRTLIEVGREAGLEEEMEWLEEILSQPVHWSAARGVAVIESPLFHIIARSDVTERQLSVQLTIGEDPSQS